MAASRGLDATDTSVELVDMGGVTNVVRHLAGLLGQRDRPTVLGMCDAGDVGFLQRALSTLGVHVPDIEAMRAAGFHVCDCDLDDELIRALGTDRVLAVLDDLGLGNRFATLQQQPAWRGKPVQAQLRRFAGVASGRKTLLGAALAAALPQALAPGPISALLDQVELAMDEEPVPAGPHSAGRGPTPGADDRQGRAGGGRRTGPSVRSRENGGINRTPRESSSPRARAHGTDDDVGSPRSDRDGPA